MKLRDLWTYTVVTVVSLLIWLWAAGETRQERTINYGHVQFAALDSSEWVISPGQQSVTMLVQGSHLAVEKIEKLLRRPLRLVVRAASGAQAIDMAQELRNLQEIRDTGATIKSVEPANVEIDLDQIERVNATVKPILRGAPIIDDLKSDPSQVSLAMPSRLRQRIPKDIPVEAVVEATELDGLERGVPHTLEVNVKVPEWLPNASSVLVTPPRVQLTFTIRSRQRDTTLDIVPVQVADLVDDRDHCVVEIEPSQLRGVTITAESDLISRIESKEVAVVAVLHLSPEDKKTHITAKAISYFIALVPDSNGGSSGTLIKGKIGDSNDPPVIAVRIRDRETTP